MAGSQVRQTAIVLVIAVIAMLVAPSLIDTYTLTVLIIYGMLALSLGLIWGFGGILCFGQAAFFGLGAYAYAIAAINIGESTVPFLVGIAVSGPTEEQARPLLLPLRDLFAAAFFVFFGLEVDVARLPDVVVPALVLAAVTAGTKVATGWWAARRIGVGSRGRRRAGVTLIARGEFSIIIAELGRAAGVVDDLPVLAAAYVLILAVVGPLATRFTEPVRAER